jgi:hypothetical protein
MTKLRGKLIRETEKAILFEVIEDPCRHLQGLTLWFGKSKTKLPKRLYKEVISIYIPEWLYDNNIPPYDVISR